MRLGIRSNSGEFGLGVFDLRDFGIEEFDLGDFNSGVFDI